MQTAILAVSSIGCVFAVGAFAVSLKTALELRKAKQQVDREVDGVKLKVAHNVEVVKDALGQMVL